MKDHDLPLRFLSICSGIEAASVAFAPLGWQSLAFAEIEPFPCAVLAHHYPQVPNLGDLSRWREWPTELLTQVDLLCGGTPCQAFSVAGLRNSLADDRGNLSLIFCELYAYINTLRRAAGLAPALLLWENVPGVLSTKDNAFGCFLAGVAGEDVPLQPARDKWTHAGYVSGPSAAAAWRVLDAQYFGLAQRRKRVFLVASADPVFDPAAVLFEFAGLRRDTPPSRKQGKDLAPTLSAHTKGGGGLGSDADADGACIAVKVGCQGMPDVVPTLLGGGNTTRGHCPPGSTVDNCNSLIPHITHYLRAVGFDASEDGTGRGTPLVPIAFDTTQITSTTNRSQPKVGDPCHTLQSGAHAPAIAFPERLSGTQCASSEDLSPVLQSHNPTAVAFQPRIARNGRGDMGEIVNALQAQSGQSGKGDAAPCVAYAIQERAICENPDAGPDGVGVRSDNLSYTLEARQVPQAVAFQNTATWRVRRLTPEECELLQGFPVGYTLIPGWTTKKRKGEDLRETVAFLESLGLAESDAAVLAHSPDGPRYKALGNSWAVPCARWIGERINQERNTKLHNT